MNDKKLQNNNFPVWPAMLHELLETARSPQSVVVGTTW